MNTYHDERGTYIKLGKGRLYVKPSLAQQEKRWIERVKFSLVKRA